LLQTKLCRGFLSSAFDSFRLREDTRPVTRAVITIAAAMLCSLAAAAPAVAAKAHTYAFDVLDARLSEVMTFQADGGPGCERAGVCGYSGTVSYSFQHVMDGVAAIVARGRQASGAGFLDIGGLTTATVQRPGGGTPCNDRILARFDGFQVEGSRVRPRLVFHHPEWSPQFLDTYCVGPKDLDVARLIPSLPLPKRSLGRRSLFAQSSATRSFRAGPFVGTLTFSAAVRLRRARFLTDLFELSLG
jgi:hypothetical protein